MRGILFICTIPALVLNAFCGMAEATPNGAAWTVTVPVEVGATSRSPSCVIGPEAVAISGELALEGLGATIILRDNQNGTHERSVDLAATTVLVAADETIQIPIQGRLTTSLVISVQFIDADGKPVSDEIVLGPCDADFPASATVALATTVTLAVSATGCTNHPGPMITVDGVVEFAGLRERIIVRDSDGSAAGEILADADIVVVPPGETLSIPKQPTDGGVGGNPWIYAQLRDSDGTPLTDEIFIGRCVG